MPIVEQVRRRNLLEWAVAYLAMSWLVLQVLDVLNEVWPISLQFQRAVHVSLGIGFPIVLVIAWFHGEPGKQGSTGPEALLITALAIIAATALLLVGGRSVAGGWVVSAVSVAAMAALPAFGALAWRVRREEGVKDEREPVRAHEDVEAVLNAELADLRRRLLMASDTTALKIIRSELHYLMKGKAPSSEMVELDVQIANAITECEGSPVDRSTRVGYVEGPAAARSLRQHLPRSMRRTLVIIFLGIVVGPLLLIQIRDVGTVTMPLHANVRQSSYVLMGFALAVASIRLVRRLVMSFPPRAPGNSPQP